MDESNLPQLNEGYFWKGMLKFFAEICLLRTWYSCGCFRAALLALLLYHQVDGEMKPLSLSKSLARGQYVDLVKSARRGPRIGATVTTLPFLQIPRWLLAAPRFPVQQSFTRIWHLSGAQFCQKLREKRIAISEWHPAAFSRSKEYECIFEASYPASGASASQAIFLIVRGGADGKVTSVRVKISLGNSDNQMRLLPKNTNVLYGLLSMQNWFDSQIIMREVENFREFRKAEFGAFISFYREKINKGNFNLRIIAGNRFP